MQAPDRKQAIFFLLRFAIVFVLLHLPLPWLADAYTSIYDSAANYLLCPILNQLSDVSMEFMPPETIEAQGHWDGNLRIQSNATGQVARTNLNIRAFSYRPLATFFALAVSARLGGFRKKALVVGGGSLLMFAVGMFISALPILARFNAIGALGVAPGLAVRTLYEAVATPVMMYAIPLIVFLAVTILSSRLSKQDPAFSQSSLSQ
jgi:hypothetical protein